MTHKSLGRRKPGKCCTAQMAKSVFYGFYYFGRRKQSSQNGISEMKILFCRDFEFLICNFFKMYINYNQNNLKNYNLNIIHREKDFSTRNVFVNLG